MEQVVDVPALERLLEDPPGMSDRRLRDPAGGAADRVIAAVERRVGAGVVVRDHDRDRERGDEHPGDGDDRARAGAPPDRVPDPYSGDDEPDLLLGRHRQHGEDREGDEPVLVEVPEGEEQERGRRARPDGTRSGSATASPGRGGRRVRTRAPRARCGGACSPARRRAARRGRRGPPGRRAASPGSARSTTAARRRRGSDRSARPGVRSASRRRSSSGGSGRVPCSRPSAPCSRGRSGRC